MKVISETCRAH